MMCLKCQHFCLHQYYESRTSWVEQWCSLDKENDNVGDHDDGVIIWQQVIFQHGMWKEDMPYKMHMLLVVETGALRVLVCEEVADKSEANVLLSVWTISSILLRIITNILNGCCLVPAKAT
eukprot:scaffold595491_cov90-Attheya_sp.AAC.1